MSLLSARDPAVVGIPIVESVFMESLKTREPLFRYEFGE
jgi:hypothetical protein